MNKPRATTTRRQWLAAALGLGAALAASPALIAQGAGNASRPLWIDVRTPGEHAQGHLEGSINIPLDVIAQRISSQAPDKNTPITLYCRSGSRSGHAQQILQSMGYTQVTNAGGYDDLKRRGVKVQ